MSRETFLERVRQAAQAGRAYRVHLEEIPANTGYVGGGEDLCRRMADEINEVGGTAHPVDNLAEARQTLNDLLKQYQVKSALCWQHPLLDKLQLADLLAEKKIIPLCYDQLANLEPDEQRKQMLSADIGITSADYAIAETGSLVVCSEPGRERLASLLPPVHVAIIEFDQILPDLFDLIEKLSDAGVDSLPSNLTIITGPSKTGDIELELTTGVHGPGQWHVIVIRASN